MDNHSVDSDSINIVVLQLKDSKIQQEPGQVSQRATIGSLPDNVLLDIFESHHIGIKTGGPKFQWDWETLVHVCQRWRYLIFESPIRLNLQLYFTELSPVTELLDVWPPFPFVINFTYDGEDDSIDNLFAALEYTDRVRKIDITSTMDFLWEEIVMAMEDSEPFPELRSLSFDSVCAKVDLPATFLNGSASCLQDLTLRSISFPSLPRLLTSTSDLTSLHLDNVPDSGYIRPDKMARCLSALPKLKSLSIIFDPSQRHFNRPHSQQRNRPVSSQTRSVLPALIFLEFSGAMEYLEVLVTQIDAPLLNRFKITFLYEPDYDHLLDLYPEPELSFDIPQIVRFFGHLERFRPSILTLGLQTRSGASLHLSSNTTSHSASPHSGSWNIQCKSLDRQVIAVTQICSQISPCSSVQSLIIESGRYRSLYSDDTDTDSDPTIWLQLFHSFPSVQSLQISDKLEPFIAVALQGLTAESAAEVFPSLHSLSVVGKKSDEAAQQGIQSFIIARQQSSHPVALSL